MRNEIDRDEEGQDGGGGGGGGLGSTAEERRRSSPGRCTKILEYVKNRNRVAPARIRLADCDFFVIGPRRTLRVLVPIPRGDLACDTPQLNDADDNFASSRVERRTSHTSLSNPRCSSFEGCETKNVSNSLNDASGRRKIDEKEPSAEKNKIVKNLEEYIDRLLREVLRDTMSLFEERGKRRWRWRQREGQTPRATASHRDGGSSESIADGYTNRGFDASTTDPDSLDLFRIEPNPSYEKENFDCTDSGINSVETSEFQTSSPPSPPPSSSSSSSSSSFSSPRELSLEQSLMEIMDAKFNEVSSERDRKIAKRDAIDDPTNLVSTSSPVVPAAAATLKDEKENVQDSTRAEEDWRAESSRLTTNLIDRFQLAKTETPGEFFFQRFARKSRRERRRWDKDEEAPTTRSSAPTVRQQQPRKPLVVFLHGFGSSAQVFHHQLEYFSNLGYPCVAPELLGHGMSSAPDRPRDYRFDKLLGDLEAILAHYRAFAPGNKCVLVAHNYGCSFASALASKYERNVDRLVLISGGGPTPLAPPSSDGPGRSCLRALLGPLLVCGLRRDLLYSARGRQHPYRGSESIEQRPSHMRYVLEGMIWPEGDCVFHRRITTPTLLIHGLRDDEVSLVQECQMERTIIKAFLDAIPTAGHTPMIDCPERVNHAIHCFVDLCKRKRR